MKQNRIVKKDSAMQAVLKKTMAFQNKEKILKAKVA